ncbi:DUF1002 domain-containing protein [Hutsoniella sourekii]
MKKITYLLLTALTVLALGTPVALADRVAIDPMFTYGESLSPSQYQETKKALGVADGVQEIEVKINELNGLLNDTYPYHQVYSSTYITPAKNEGGVTVEIVTPQTITDITPLQYQNAAITAGAVDVNIKVASAVRVDGSGALAGVYKSFQQAGQALDSQAVSVAQDELAVTSQITEENKTNSDYSDEVLNAAIAEIKTNIQEVKQTGNGNISNQEVHKIVNNVINNYNLNNVISDNNVQMLVNQMNNFSRLEFTPEQQAQLRQLGQKITQQGGQLFKDAQTAWDQADKNAIMSFLSDLWQAIVGFFQGLFA